LKAKHLAPASFGQKYALSIDATMAVALDMLEEDAKELLYTMAL
jgi:hypothetical protein